MNDFINRMDEICAAKDSVIACSHSTTYVLDLLLSGVFVLDIYELYCCCLLLNWTEKNLRLK